jgi:hypothetical protein
LGIVTKGIRLKSTVMRLLELSMLLAESAVREVFPRLAIVWYRFCRGASEQDMMQLLPQLMPAVTLNVKAGSWLPLMLVRALMA